MSHWNQQPLRRWVLFSPLLRRGSGVEERERLGGPGQPEGRPESVACPPNRNEATLTGACPVGAPKPSSAQTAACSSIFLLWGQVPCTFHGDHARNHKLIRIKGESEWLPWVPFLLRAEKRFRNFGGQRSSQRLLPESKGAGGRR